MLWSTTIGVYNDQQLIYYAAPVAFRVNIPESHVGEKSFCVYLSQNPLKIQTSRVNVAGKNVTCQTFFVKLWSTCVKHLWTNVKSRPEIVEWQTVGVSLTKNHVKEQSESVESAATDVKCLPAIVKYQSTNVKCQTACVKHGLTGVIWLPTNVKCHPEIVKWLTDGVILTKSRVNEHPEYAEGGGKAVTCQTFSPTVQPDCVMVQKVCTEVQSFFTDIVKLFFTKQSFDFGGPRLSAAVLWFDVQLPIYFFREQPLQGVAPKFYVAESTVGVPWQPWMFVRD